MELYARLVKYDPFKGIATGCAAAEEVDRDGECMDYLNSKPYFQAWSNSVLKDSQGKSFGNIRINHDTTRPVGKLIQPLEFNDTMKQIRITAQVFEKDARDMLAAGVLTGFSIGGKYLKRTQLPNGVVKYVASPSEVSIVDRPCGPSAVFESVKADGSTELRKFAARQIPTTGFDEQRAEELLRMGIDLGQIGLMLGKSTGQMQMWARDRLKKFNLLYERDWRGAAIEEGDSVAKARPDRKIKRTRKSNAELASEDKDAMEQRIHDLITAAVAGAHATVACAAKAQRHPNYWQRQEQALRKHYGG